jgi:transcription initiation factor TFIID subunit 6
MRQQGPAWILSADSQPVLIPPRPLAQPAFQAVNIPLASGSNQTIYHVPDDEIEFSTYLKEPLPAGLANSAGVKWKAHWLAVEGVQPAIPENPAPASRAGRELPLLHWSGLRSRLTTASRSLPSSGPSALKPAARTQLPQELQLYYSRLTTALVPSIGGPEDAAKEWERMHTAALASLASDSAVGGILPYLVKWFVESIGKCLVNPIGVGWALLHGLERLLHNESIFIEPYVS